MGLARHDCGNATQALLQGPGTPGQRWTVTQPASPSQSCAGSTPAERGVAVRPPAASSAVRLLSVLAEGRSLETAACGVRCVESTSFAAPPCIAGRSVTGGVSLGVELAPRSAVRLRWSQAADSNASSKTTVGPRGPRAPSRRSANRMSLLCTSHHSARDEAPVSHTAATTLREIARRQLQTNPTQRNC